MYAVLEKSALTHKQAYIGVMQFETIIPDDLWYNGSRNTSVNGTIQLNRAREVCFIISL